MLNVIVATDLSEAGMLGVDAVCALGPGVFAHVMLAHVVDLDPYTGGGAVPEIMEFAEKRLAEEAEHLREYGIAVEVEVRQGDAVETLERLARDRRADFVVTTSLGRGALLGRLFGSTVERLASRSRVAVLVVRVTVAESGTCTLGGDEMTFARILVGAGLDDAMPELLRRVAGLPGLGRVRVVHAHRPDADIGTIPDELREAAHRAGLPEVAEILLCPGEPGQVLMREAEQLPATLLALGASRQGVVRSLVHGSVARTVAHGTECSLLLVPPGEAK